MTAVEFLKSEFSPFDDVKLVCIDWLGYKVYEPIMKDGSCPCVGLPYFILEKEDKLRWTDDKECFEVLNFVYPKTNED
ncbi:hypothetical protein [Treponema pectinovorum]|uniref:hypothetical protein n=1 Tax=Treponema pectinovorum TaxID=164 RepID=UPI0011C7E0C2|nr:hypothetical protein [Treponema pectinovorum]